MDFRVIKIIFFLCSIILASQEGKVFKGYYLLNNFGVNEIKIRQSPQSWSVAQDSQGVLFFANTKGVLEYDELSWKRISVPNNVARSLSISNTGLIFIGGFNEFGYLLSDSSHSLEYFSLLNKINSVDRKFSGVFQIHQNKNGVYFRTANSLSRLYQDSITTLRPATKFIRSFLIDSTIYIGEDGIGLNRVTNDGLKLIEGGELFADNYAWVFVKTEDGKDLIGARDGSFFIYDGLTFTPFQTETDNYINENKLYHGINLSDGNIALATLQGGVLIINKEGKLVDFYNEATGLQDNNVKYVYQDKQDNLWLALNNGISKIEYSSPFSVFDKRMGLDGIVLSMAKLQDNLYAGTTNGLFKLNPTNNGVSNYRLNNFKKDDRINSNVWVLLKLDDELLAGASEGVYLINSEDKAKKISSYRVYSMQSYNKNRSLIILGTRDGLGALYDDGIKWTEYNLYSKINSRISTVSVSLEDNIWIGTLSAGVLKISDSANILGNILNRKNPSIKESYITRYDTSSGLPPGGINIFGVSNRQLFATGKGIYKFDEETQKFVPDSTFGAKFADGSRGVFQIVEDENRNIWMHSYNENFLAEYQKDGSYKIISKPFRRIEKSQVNAIYPDGDVVWFGRSTNDIIKYNTRKKKKFVTDFNALIRKVLINGDSLIYGGAPLPKDFKPLSLEYDDRNLRFQYACPFYEGEERTEFQYKLVGFDEDWSDWKIETQKDYTNLSEGSYIFSVRAKNIYGDISKTAAYSFKVLPPFYRTAWAYLLYSVSFLAFGFLIVKWRINKLEKEKEQLSKLVDEKAGEVKKQNIRLSEQADKLQELDKIKSRFFANISHEFRTPLTLILGPARQMLKKKRAEGEKKDLSLILRNSQKLLSLINQLLDISKLESGKMQLRLRKINLIQFIREITFMFESLADRKKIKLGFYSELEEIELYCDTDKIEKVMVNLLSNAFKFTEEIGEVTVIISKEGGGETTPEGSAKIMVIDSGIGIPGESLKHIFDPFYQADASTKREYEGTGIGLALVKEFIELHKGSVKVESNEEKGTKFIIRLPLSKSHFKPGEIIEEEYDENITGQLDFAIDMHEEISKNGTAGEVNGTDQPGEKETVLVVDDTADVRDYVKEHLEKDYNIIEASDGEEGLEKAREAFPDLIVSDVMMPKMDGFELCENIKKDVNTSHIPVILLTAKAGDENKMYGLETGADDYVIKPFNVEMLYIRIKNLIELRKQLQQKYQKQLILEPDEIKVTSVDEAFLKKLHGMVEENLADPEFSLENLMDKFNITYKSFYRKVKVLTGQPPGKFLRSYRLKRAAQLIQAKSGNITEIAFSVGFNNSAYFTKCFREQFNRLPSEFHSIEN